MSKWEFLELSKLCDLEKGKTGLMKAKEGEYTLVATGKNRRTCDTYQFDTKAVCVPLVSSTGHGHASLKYVHYQEGKFALGTILVAVIPKDENILNAQFLHLYLSRLKDTVLVPLMTGAANVTLTVTKLKTVKVPLPPIEEQLRIVSLFNRMDNEQAELTDEITHQQTLLKKLRQSILQEAIEGELTASWREQNPNVESASVLLEKIKQEKEQLVIDKKIKKQKPLPPINGDEIPFNIPDSWEWCRLGTISAKIGSGSTPRGSNYSESGIPFFRSQNIHNSGLVYSDIKYISNEIHKKMSRTKVLPEDILLNITGGSMGRCTYVPKDFNDANLSQHVCIIRPILLNPIYLHNLVLSPIFQDMIFSSTTGAGREGLPKNNLEQFVIPIIPLEEQKEIVKKIENLFKICDELETQINSSKNNSQTLMQAVLKEAFEK
jgi:type I restriction enzyme S subunit